MLSFVAFFVEQCVPEQLEKAGESDAFDNVTQLTAACAGRSVDHIPAVIGLEVQVVSFIDTSATLAAPADMLMELEHIQYFLSLYRYKQTTIT